MVCKQALACVLWTQRESASRGYPAKFEGRPVCVKNRPEYIFLVVIKFPLTARRFLWRQMLRFFLFRIGDRLGPRGSGIGNSRVLRACAKRNRNTACDEKNGELSVKSNSHGHLS